MTKFTSCNSNPNGIDGDWRSSTAGLQFSVNKVECAVANCLAGGMAAKVAIPATDCLDTTVTSTGKYETACILMHNREENREDIA